LEYNIHDKKYNNNNIYMAENNSKSMRKIKCYYSNVTSLNNKLVVLAIELYSNGIYIAFITKT